MKNELDDRYWKIAIRHISGGVFHPNLASEMENLVKDHVKYDVLTLEEADQVISKMDGHIKEAFA